MNARWLKRLSLAIAIVLMADVAFAGQTTPAWTTRIDAGSAVRVTLRDGVVFDAIWMGRDGVRAVFERFDPHETVSVPLEAVRKVKGRGGPSPDTAQAFGGRSEFLALLRVFSGQASCWCGSWYHALSRSPFLSRLAP